MIKEDKKGWEEENKWKNKMDGSELEKRKSWGGGGFISILVVLCMGLALLPTAAFAKDMEGPEAAPVVTNVSVDPAAANILKGKTQKFSATVSGTDSPATTVKWTVEGGTGGTSINGDGLLTVGAGETAASLTVKATSTADESKSGTATVTFNVAKNLQTEKKYLDFQSAVNEVKDGQTIQVLLDQSRARITIPKTNTAHFTLDLCGKLLQSQNPNYQAIITYNGGGTLTISDSIGGGVLFNQLSSGGPAIAGTGSVIISGGTVKSLNKSGIDIKGGTITIDGGSVESRGAAAITSHNGKIIVKSGSVSGIAGPAIDSDNSTITIIGGELWHRSDRVYGKDTNIINLRNMPRSSEAPLLQISGGKVSTIGKDKAVYFQDAYVTGSNLAQYYKKTGGTVEGEVFPIPVFANIIISSPPTKTTYTAGESFDKTGMVVKAVYTDNSQKAVTDYTVSPKVLQISDNKAIVSYTDGGVSKTADITITVKAAPVVTNVSVTPSTATVQKGGTQKFSATVTGTDSPATTVKWTVEGGKAGTSINGEGLLTVAADETAASLKVKATSTADESKSGTATVTVKEAAPAVTSVSVTPSTATVQKGGTQKFSATVTGTDSPATTVKWTVEGGKAGTFINEEGLLTLAADETAASLTVKATSTADESKSGTATVTVKEAAPAVTSVSVTPSTATVQKGGTQKFSATVTGTDSPATTVKWTVEGGKAGTSINEEGLLTVAADETAASLKVKATSTADESKSGTATVTVKPQASAPTATYTITATAGTGGSISPSGSVTVDQGKNQTFTMTPDSNYSITDVKVDSQSKGVIPSYTFENVTGNHSIEVLFNRNGGDSHSGGSGSSHSGDSSSHSGGSSDGSSQSAPESTPAEPGIGTSNITASVDENGSANATITDQNIEDAVNEAKKGANGGAITVIVNVSSQGKDADSLSVNLPEAVQDRVISEKIRHFSIRVDKPEISVGFNLAAITAINKQANADVEIAAERTDRKKLSAEAQAAIGSRPAFDLTATYAGGTKNVSSFGTGSATLEIPYTLGKGELADRVCAVYVDKNGKVQYLNNSSYDAKRQILRFTTDHFSVYGVGYRQETPSFTDIEGHWAKEDILFAANRDLFTGTSATTFSPDEAMTGGMLVTALGHLAGIDPADYKTGELVDMEPDAYYAPYVNWAVEKGIVNSTSGGAFSPERAISREQMVVIMSHYANVMGIQIPETQAAVTFADSGTISGYAASAIKQMQMAGILSGRDGNYFDPQKNATRGEAASILHRYVEQVLDRSNS